MIATSLVLLAATVVATPPPEIARAHSAAFCTALRDRIEPAAQLLSENDRKYLGVSNLYQVTSDMGRVRGSYLVGGAVMNFEAIDKLLEAQSQSASTQDERELNQLRKQLLDVRATQNEMVNIINGEMDTASYEQMMSDLPNFASPVDASIASERSPTSSHISMTMHSAPMATPDDMIEAVWGYRPGTLALNRRLARDRAGLHDQFESAVVPMMAKLMDDCR